jgi:hypothetical protein
MSKPQSFENHTKLVPGFHGFVFPVFAINWFWSLYGLYRAPGIDAVIRVLVASALIGLALYARLFALRVQDRVIRLEMRLRLARWLPAAAQPDVDRFTIGQLVALRFASDEELPELAARVLKENLHDKREIKKRIRNWQADHDRA